jgi:phenylalanyl-tRNA synthetase beta chain
VPTSDTSVIGVAQPLRLGGLAYGPVDGAQWGSRERNVDFFDVKGDVEALFAPRAVRFVVAEHAALHPGRAARVLVEDREVGVVGELHPRWRQAYELPLAPVVFELDIEALLERQVPVAQPVPRQQSVVRDLALIVRDQVDAGTVLDALRSAPHQGLLRDARMFDVYRPATPQPGMADGERSLAVRLELLDDNAPLTDARCDEVVASLLSTVAAQTGARLRGA